MHKRKISEKKDSHLYSIVKSISYRLLSTAATIAIVLLFTGKLMIAFQVGIFEMFSKIFLYYFHERLWNGRRLGNGIKKADKYEESTL